MDLKNLPPDDRLDFENRLKRLGVDAEALEDEVIEVESGQNLRLEMVGNSPISPMIFETADLDTLRRWIGSPDRAIEGRVKQPFETILSKGSFAANVLAAPAVSRKRRSMTAKSTASGVGTSLAELVKIEPQALLESVVRAKAEPANFKLGTSEVETIRAAARNYIHGDLKLVENYKPALETFFGSFQVAVWLKTRITVKKDSTLTLGSGVHNLTAYEMVIEPGGRVRSHGHLTVSVTKIRQTGSLNPGIVLPDHVLAVDTLPLDPVFP